ncbi:MAG: hypothetical protein ACRELX_01325, partial [Longimicrobiales bacterium]
VGFFLMATSALVLVPLVLQLRARENALREVWGYFLFVVGLGAVGIGYAFMEGPDQRRVALGGLAVLLIGLLVQHADRRSERGPQR